MEPDFYAMAPEGVSTHSTRMMLRDVTPEGLESMAEDAVNAAELLSTAGVDIIVYGCTSGSLLKGVEWEASLVERLQKATGISTITTVGAVVEALREVRAAKIAVVTPYIDELNQLERAFLEANGFSIASINGLGFTDNLDIGKVSPGEIHGLIEQTADADCLFISCTNLPVVRMIQELEAQYNVPVITSNQASMWLALRSLGQGPVEGYGILLQDY
jgi:maleate isomerase